MRRSAAAPAGLAAFLLLAASAPAGAFLFGGASGKRAAERLAAMRSAFESGDCVAVQEASDPFFAEKPSNPLREEAYGYLGRCSEAGGLVDKAIGTYKLALELFPENASFALRLALIYNKAGFYESAVPLFLKILELKKDDGEASLGLARSYYRLGFLGRAAELFSRAAAMKDFSVPEVMREYALCLLEKRDWDGTLAIIAKGRELEPGEAFWRVLAARVMAGRGDYRRAVSEMDDAIKISASRQWRLERALYLLLGGSPGPAAEVADAELVVNGADALAASVKALALYSGGETKKAEAYFSVAAASGGAFTGRLAAAFLEAGRNGGGSCKK